MAWKSADLIGYKPITTFWEDFSIADKFGEGAIRDTAERAYTEWHTDYRYLTELVMVLNHKAWEHENNSKLCKLYSDLYYIYDDAALNELTGNEEAMQYYFKTLD